jgi:hypothetical protein
MHSARLHFRVHTKMTYDDMNMYIIYRSSTIAPKSILAHPLSKNHFSKCLQVLKKILSVYLDILYSLTKFREKRHFFVMYEKDNFRCYKIAIYVTFIFLFIKAARNFFSLQNFGGCT